MAERTPFYTLPLIEIARSKNEAVLAGAVFKAVIRNALATHVNHAVTSIDEALKMAVPETEPPLTIYVSRATDKEGEQEFYAALYKGASDLPEARYITDDDESSVKRHNFDPTEQLPETMEERLLDAVFRESWLGIDGLRISLSEAYAFQVHLEQGVPYTNNPA